MKVVVAAPLVPPEIGGPATHVAFLRDYAPSLGLTLEIVPYRDVRHLPRAARHIAYAIHLAAHVRGADYIYALDPVSVGLPAALVAMLFRKPLVVRIVGDYAWEQGTQRFGITDNLDTYLGKTYGTPVNLLRMIQRFVARRAARIIAPSRYFKGVIERWGIEGGKIGVVYSAAPTLSFLSKEAARVYVGAGYGPYVVSVGRLVPWKGFDALLDAFDVVKKRIKEAQLIIVGDGPERQKLESRIKSLSLTSAVRLTGALPREELMHYLASADLFVLNTHYEGLSHQLLEVMEARVPIVTTPVGGNPELLSPDAAVMVAPDDVPALASAMLRVLEDASFANALAGRAHQSLGRFSPDVSARGIAEELRSVVKHP